MEEITLEEIQQSDWYKERPKIIQEAIDVLPPIHLYRFKDSKQECYIYSYSEPDLERTDTDMFKTVTVTVQKTGEGGAMSKIGLGFLNTNMVFGVKLDDLEICNK